MVPFIELSYKRELMKFGTFYFTIPRDAESELSAPKIGDTLRIVRNYSDVFLGIIRDMDIREDTLYFEGTGYGEDWEEYIDENRVVWKNTTERTILTDLCNDVGYSLGNTTNDPVTQFEKNFEKTIDLLTTLAIRQGKEWKLYPETKKVDFLKEVGNDLTSTVRFQRGINLVALSVKKSDAQRYDKIIVLGSGDGSKQLKTTRGVGRKVNVYTDKGIKKQADLEKWADELWKECNQPEIISYEAEIDSGLFMFDVGDKVWVEDFKNNISEAMRVLSYSVTYNQTEQIKVTLANRKKDLFDFFKRLEKGQNTLNNVHHSSAVQAGSMVVVDDEYNPIQIQVASGELINTTTGSTIGAIENKAANAETTATNAENKATQAQNDASNALNTAQNAEATAQQAETTANNAQAIAESREKGIPRQSTAPSNPQVDDFWLDTSVNPNRLRRWDGSTWVYATPTQAIDIGAYDTATTDSKISTAENNAKTYADSKYGNLINNTTKTGTLDKWTGSPLSVVNKDFFGATVPVQQVYTSGNTMVISDFIEVDPSKAYEVTFWFMADGLGGTDYFGLYGYDASQENIGIDMVNISDTTLATKNTNPYFWSGDNDPINTWIKRTAYIMPAGTDLSKFKGLGENITHSARMLPNTKYIRVRWLNFYNNGVAKNVWVANPKVVEMPSETKGMIDTAENNAKSYADTQYSDTKSLVDGWKYSNTTYIDGGDIYTGTVTANQIASRTITANKIASGTLTANELASNSVTADKIVAGAIQTSHIATAGLNAQVIKAGTLNADLVSVQSNTSEITINSNGITVGTNGAVTTINKNGVNVKDGSFTLEDSNSAGHKYRLSPKTNLIVDHSFEMIEGTGSVDSNGYFAIPAQSDLWYQWATVGNPRLNSNLQTDVASTAPFGNQAVAVNSANYVKQAFQVRPNRKYSISFHAKFSNYNTSQSNVGIPQLKVSFYGEGFLVQSYTQNFSAPLWQDGAVRRFVYEGVMAPNALSNYMEYWAEIEIKTTNSNWVEIDGVQVVESEQAHVYDSEDNIWIMRRGLDKYPSINTWGKVKAGTIEASHINLLIPTTDDVSGTSQGVGFVIGNATTGNSLKMDTNELSAFSSGGVGTLHLNPDGGNVTINNSIGDKWIFDATTRYLQMPRYKYPNGYNMLSVRDGSNHDDLMMIQNIIVTVNFSNAKYSFADFNFPVAFSATPIWCLATAVNVNSYRYTASIYNLSSTGARVYLHDVDGGAFTHSIQVQVVACGKRI